MLPCVLLVDSSASLIFHPGGWLPPEGARVAFWTRILAWGYDNGPAGGPGGRGSTDPRVLFLGRRDCLSWSWGLRECVYPLPRDGDRLGPRPGRLDFQVAAPAAAHLPVRMTSSTRAWTLWAASM